MRLLLTAFLLISHSCVYAAGSASPAPANAETDSTTSTDAGQQKIYKWVDEKGQIHYADRPRAEGDEPVDLPTLQVVDSVTLPPIEATPPADNPPPTKSEQNTTSNNSGTEKPQ